MITRAPFLTWSLLLGEEFRPPLSTEKRSKGLNSSLRGQIKRRGKIGRGLNIHIRKNTIYVGHSYFTAALVVVHHRFSDEGNWAYLNFAYVEIGQVKYCDFSCVPFLELKAGSFKMAKTFYDLTFLRQRILYYERKVRMSQSQQNRQIYMIMVFLLHPWKTKLLARLCQEDLLTKWDLWGVTNVVMRKNEVIFKSKETLLICRDAAGRHGSGRVG